MGQEYESCRVDRQRRADAYRVQLAESRTDSSSRIYAASNQETCIGCHVDLPAQVRHRQLSQLSQESQGWPSRWTMTGETWATLGVSWNLSRPRYGFTRISFRDQ